MHLITSFGYEWLQDPYSPGHEVATSPEPKQHEEMLETPGSTRRTLTDSPESPAGTPEMHVFTPPQAEHIEQEQQEQQEQKEQQELPETRKPKPKRKAAAKTSAKKSASAGSRLSSKAQAKAKAKGKALKTKADPKGKAEASKDSKGSKVVKVKDEIERKLHSVL